MNQDDQTKRDSCCWLLADNTLEECKSYNEVHRVTLKAKLIHSLLFNVFEQKLVFSDSQLLNNSTLRMLIRNDDLVKEVFTSSQMVRIAVRDHGDGTMPGPKDLIQAAKTNGNYLFDPKLPEGDELEAVWRNSPVSRFSLAQIGANYERDVLKLFRGEVGARELGNSNLSQEIAELAVRHVQQNGGPLKWIFFYEQLRPILESLYPRGSIWKQYGDKINIIAKGPYQAGLPKLLNADPIYAREHADSFRIMRGKQRVNEVLRRPESSRVQLSTGCLAFERGLLAMSFEDIIQALDSDEAEEFRKARNEFDGSDEADRRLRLRAAMYVQEIERTILFNKPELRHEPADGNYVDISSSTKAFETAGQGIDGGDLLEGFIGFSEMVEFVIDWTGRLHFLTSLVLDQFKRRIEADRKKREAENNALEIERRSKFIKQQMKQGEAELEIEIVRERVTDSVGQVLWTGDSIETAYGVTENG